MPRPGSLVVWQTHVFCWAAVAIQHQCQLCGMENRCGRSAQEAELKTVLTAPASRPVNLVLFLLTLGLLTMACLFLAFQKTTDWQIKL